MHGKCRKRRNALATMAILLFPACITSPSGTVHGTDDTTSRRRGGTITRDVPHSEETMKEVQDNETRNPPTDNTSRVAPYHEGSPPVELPPFPNLPHPLRQDENGRETQ